MGDDVVSERRIWPRRECNGEEALIWLDVQRSSLARLANESMTGICLIVPDTLPLAKEQEVRIEYNGQRLWAIVRHITERPGAERLVGFEWGSRTVRIDPAAFEPDTRS